MIVIIGVGNPLRGDDGVGAAAAQAVAEAMAHAPEGVRLFTPHQLVPELAAWVAEADSVVFVDAAAGGEPGCVHCDRVTTAPGDAAPSLHHAMTPAGLVALARAAYGRAPDGWLIRIDGEAFDHGAPMSDAVRAAIPRAVARATTTVGVNLTI